MKTPGEPVNRREGEREGEGEGEGEREVKQTLCYVVTVVSRVIQHQPEAGWMYDIINF